MGCAEGVDDETGDAAVVEHGERCGVGVYALATGEKYAGEFKNGAMTGFGMLTKKFKDDFFALYGRFDEDKFVEEDKANAEAAAERAEPSFEPGDDGDGAAQTSRVQRVGSRTTPGLHADGRSMIRVVLAGTCRCSAIYF